MGRKPVILVALTLLALGSSGADAATFTVTNLLDNGPGSLRQAVSDANAAPSASTITFKSGLAGTVTLTSGPLVVLKTVTIQGPGAQGLAVSGGQQSRVFILSAAAEISGLAIEQGNAGPDDDGDGGGGVFIIGSEVSLTDCDIHDNSGINESNGKSDGGGILNLGGLVAISNCTLSHNVGRFGANIANESGGTLLLTNCDVSNLDPPPGIFGGSGLFNDSSTATLTGCTLHDNSAQSGGGIDNQSGILTLTHCTLESNLAGGGGALANLSGGSATLTDCTLSNNVAGPGGAILNDFGSTLVLSGCTLNDNLSGGFRGGGIENRGTATLTNSTLSQNLVINEEDAEFNGGGGLVNDGTGQVLMQNCTFSGNSSKFGGAINNRGVIKIGNTLVANSPAGVNCVQGGPSPFMVSLGHNLDSDGTLGLTDPSDQHGSVEAPLDPAIGPLQDNGGPTLTHALLPGSPCIDTGTNLLAPGLKDQRGFPRVADGDGNGTAVIDIGAYEFSLFRLRFPPGLGQFLGFTTVQARETLLRSGTRTFNLTLYYSRAIDPGSFTAKINGQEITGLFHPATPLGFETVSIPLRAGENELVLGVKGTSDGHPGEEVDSLGFRVGDPPFGPR